MAQNSEVTPLPTARRMLRAVVVWSLGVSGLLSDAWERAWPGPSTQPQFALGLRSSFRVGIGEHDGLDNNGRIARRNLERESYLAAERESRHHAEGNLQ